SAEQRAVERALAAQPADRWDSCRELVAELTRKTTESRARERAETTSERRKSARRPGSVHASCRLLLTRGNTAGDVKIEDISAEGIRLLVSGPRFDNNPGTTLSLALANKVQGLLRVARMKILHRIVLPGGDCVLAGRFENPLRAEDLRALAE